MYAALFILIVVCVTSSAFVLTNQRTVTRRLVRVQSTPEGGDAPAPAAPAGPVSKGFGTVKPKAEKEEEVKDAGTMTYESQAKRGVPEYNIFLRPTNGSEAEWTPVGSMTIPRDTAVSKAVLEVEDELLKGIHPPSYCYPYQYYLVQLAPHCPSPSPYQHSSRFSERSADIERCLQIVSQIESFLGRAIGQNR